MALGAFICAVGCIWSTTVRVLRHFGISHELLLRAWRTRLAQSPRLSAVYDKISFLFIWYFSGWKFADVRTLVTLTAVQFGVCAFSAFTLIDEMSEVLSVIVYHLLVFLILFIAVCGLSVSAYRRASKVDQAAAGLLHLLMSASAIYINVAAVDARTKGMSGTGRVHNRVTLATTSFIVRLQSQTALCAH